MCWIESTEIFGTEAFVYQLFSLKIGKCSDLCVCFNGVVFLLITLSFFHTKYPDIFAEDALLDTTCLM